MKFGSDGDTTLIENGKLVSVLGELLSTKQENVEKALLYRTVATGRDVIDKQHTPQEASYGRDALAKVRPHGSRIAPVLCSHKSQVSKPPMPQPSDF